MATEIALLPLHKGKSPEDANSPSGQALKDCLDTLTEQEGFQRAYWGTELENLDLLHLYIDWDDVDSHKKFMASPQYGPFLDRFGTIMSDKPTTYHTHFFPHPASAALGANVGATEVLTVYFPPSYSKTDQEKFEGDIKKLVDMIEKHAKAYKGSAGGWAIEEVTIPGTSESAKAYITVIGWSSVEAHTAFRDTQHFKDSIHYLREAKDMKKSTFVHVSLKEVQAGGGVADPTGSTAQEEILNL